MGFTVPAVHYSALATLPPELTASKSQYSIQHTASVRFGFSQIFKKLLNSDIHNEQTKTEKRIQSSEITEKGNDASIVIKTPSNNISGNRTPSTSFVVEPLERLPFAEPYFSTTPKNEQIPFELSTYHKHCIRQEKYIDQKRYHPQSLSITEKRSDLMNNRLQKLTDQQHQIKLSQKTLPELPSIEDQIALKYASQRNTLTTNYGTRSSYLQQQTQHLRRLNSKSKIRPISNESKPSTSSSISSSIAHRIELLKQAMHNHQLEIHQPKSPPIESSSPSIIDTTHKQTQTNETQLKSSEIHHIHHHHIYPSSIFSMPWRTYFSILGTIVLIFLLLFQFITINF